MRNLPSFCLVSVAFNRSKNKVGNQQQRDKQRLEEFCFLFKKSLGMFDFDVVFIRSYFSVATRRDDENTRRMLSS